MAPKRRKRALTLVEVMMTMTITLILFLSMMGGIIYSIRAQKLAREHSAASRRAAMLIEEARRLTFQDLEPFSGRNILIDDNRTATTRDDIRGTGELILAETNGTRIPNAKTANYILVEARVRWSSMGAPRAVSVVTHFAP